ncbi:unnamed protein product [Closterium sp. NIES-64]|nr:unnamed protein product [Closterium sp. NIES-64]
MAPLFSPPSRKEQCRGWQQWEEAAWHRDRRRVGAGAGVQGKHGRWRRGDGDREGEGRGGVMGVSESDAKGCAAVGRESGNEAEGNMPDGEGAGEHGAREGGTHGAREGGTHGAREGGTQGEEEAREAAVRAMEAFLLRPQPYEYPLHHHTTLCTTTVPSAAPQYPQHIMSDLSTLPPLPRNSLSLNRPMHPSTTWPVVIQVAKGLCLGSDYAQGVSAAPTSPRSGAEGGSSGRWRRGIELTGGWEQTQGYMKRMDSGGGELGAGKRGGRGVVMGLSESDARGCAGVGKGGGSGAEGNMCALTITMCTLTITRCALKEHHLLVVVDIAWLQNRSCFSPCAHPLPVRSHWCVGEPDWLARVSVDWVPARMAARDKQQQTPRIAWCMGGNEKGCWKGNSMAACEVTMQQGAWGSGGVGDAGDDAHHLTKSGLYSVSVQGSEGQPPGGAGTNEEVQSEDGSDWESDFDDGDSTESDDDDSAVDENDFNTALEFFRFVIGCNGGQGLSDEATVWLFKLLRDPRLDLEAIRRWRTKHAVLQYGLRLMMARRVYRQVEVRIPGIDHTFELMCTSPIENALDEIYGPGQVVAPIILSSDAMILSGNERVKVWAVYLSIANIHLRLRWGDSGKILLALLPMPVHGMTAEQKVQLFQAAMQVVLADLIAASHTGIAARDPWGVDRVIWPLLFSYVADFPETCKVSCTQQHGSHMPCSLCYVDRGQLRNMTAAASESRSVDQQSSLIANPRLARTHLLGGCPARLSALAFVRPYSVRPCHCPPLPLSALATVRPCLCPPLSLSALCLCPPLPLSALASVRPCLCPPLPLSAPCLFPPLPCVYLLCPPLPLSAPCLFPPLPCGYLPLSALCLCPPLASSRPCPVGARQAGLLTPGDASYWVSGANFTASEHAAVMMVRPYLLVYALVRVPNGRDGCQMAFADYALPVWQIVPFVLEGEVAVICSRTIVAFLDWHETFVRAAEHTDESLSAFDTATRRMVQLVESTFPREHSGWNLVKVHLLLHLTEAIRRGGLPREYSAAVYENAHIRTCKRPYRQSNHRDVGRVIAQHNTNAALLTRIPTNLEGNRQYNTAMRRAIASGLPQLCRQRSRMHSAITDREQAPLDLYATFDAAIPGGIGPYAYLTRLFGYVSFPAWVHTALALPARGTDHGLIRPHYVRANPSHHGAATFSFIEYEDGTGETVVGRVHLLLTLMMNSEDAHPAGEAVAFVRQWYPYLEDECTGCMRMRPSDDELSYNLVPVASVQRTMHMVESFVTPGL